MARRSINRFRGIVTQPDKLDLADGALAAATNCSLERSGVLMPRRGVDVHFAVSRLTTPFRFYEFDGTRLLHWQDSGGDYFLSYDTGLAWTALSGAYQHPNGLDFQMQGAVVNDRLFLTEASGVRRLDTSSTTPVFAGAPKCPSMDRYNSATPDSASGVLTAQTQRAYRAVIFFQDTDDRRIFGSPSPRMVLRNENASGGSAKAPTVRVLLPKQNGTTATALTTDYWVQLYASPLSPDLSTEPSDDMGLIYEAQLTSTNITNGYVDVADITPDSLRGAALYTNQTQGTLVWANEPPPHAYCAAEYRGCLLLGNVYFRHRFELTILAVGGTSGIQDSDTLTIDNFTVTAKTTPAATTDYALVTGATTSQNIVLTAQNLCAAINRHTSNTSVYAYYAGTPNDPRSLGRIIIERREANAASFNVYVGAGDNNACFEPTLPQGSASADVVSVADEWPNGWALSKPQQGDAFPLLLNGRMGVGNVIAIAALGDEAFFFHDSGEVWRMTGDPPVSGRDTGTLRVDPWRQNLKLLAPKSVAVLDGRIYCLTNQGVIRMNGAGYEIVSEPIQTTLYEAIHAAGYDSIRQNAWAFAHPTDRRYVLSIRTDSSRTQYVFWALAEGWTTANYNFAAGHYSQADGRVYFGTADATHRENLGTAAGDYDDDGRAFTATITTPPLVTGDGSVASQWRELQAVFEGSQPSSITATFTTEHATDSVTVSSQSSNVARIPVPRACQRAARLEVSLSIATTATKWRLSGLTLIGRSYGERVTK